MLCIEMAPPDQLRPNPRNTRVHSKRQIRKIADSISAFGFLIPILADENNQIIAGHGRLAAAKLLGLVEVPVIPVTGLSEARKRALAIADNKIASDATWDRESLHDELRALPALLAAEALEVDITGFEPAEIDVLQVDLEEYSSDPDDHVGPDLSKGPMVTRPSDLWILGNHKLMCGDARDHKVLQLLMDGELAAVALLDPPYNTPATFIGGRGRIKHENFAMAHGELSSEQFVEFLSASLQAAADVSRDGALHFVFMDWRSIAELLRAGQTAYGSYLNLVVWDKVNAGQGSFYRSQHELIGVFRVGNAAHTNNIQLGRFGRNRSNVWTYPGSNGFRAGRNEDLLAHPTVKPTRLVIDALKDCTRRSDIVLDTFAGSGTTILAAERCGRRARAIEIEPRYIDTAIRRWQKFTGKDAVHAATGLTFDETALRPGGASHG